MERVFVRSAVLALIAGIAGILYWVCFSPNFYTFVMSFSEV